MRSNRSWFGMVSLALMLGIFFLVVNQLNVDRQSGQPNQDNQPNQPPDTATGTQPDEGLLYLVNKDLNTYQLVAYNITSDQKSDLISINFPRPIVNVIGQTTNGAIWAMLAGSDEFNSSLVRVDPQGKVEVIIDSLVLMGLPAVSPDGVNLAYVTFSNAESDFGFKLIERSLVSDGVKMLATNSSGIGWPRYCFKAQICYISQTGQTSKITSRSPDGKTEQVVYQTESNLIDWSVSSDRMVVIERPNPGINRLVLIASDQPSIIESTSETVRQIYLSKTSPRVATFRLKKATDQEGSIILTDLDTRQSKIVSEKANFLIGWRTKP